MSIKQKDINAALAKHNVGTGETTVREIMAIAKDADNALPEIRRPAEVATMDPDILDAVSGDGNKFLRRLQFMSAMASAVKEDPEHNPVNNFALTDGTDLQYVGNGSCECVLLASRPFALDNSNEDAVVCMTPEVVDDPVTGRKKIIGLFAEIMAKANDKELNKAGQIMYGPQFLIWFPATREFATLLLGNKTLRNIARDFEAKIGQGVELFKTFIEGKSYSWWSFKVRLSQTPMEMPPEEAIEYEIHRFKNPEVVEVQTADEAAETGTDVER